jgi:DNA-binding transcriptional LysR family regulator
MRAAPATLEANDLVLFSRVADEGSFSRAALRLHMPKSTLSRRVAALEAELGERLLLRTTRKLTLTDFGRAVLEHARHVADDVDAAIALAQHRQAEPGGRLRVTMPGDFAHRLLAPMLAQFSLAYPAITLEIDLTARFVDLVGENVDVAVRMGELADDASLAARRIATLGASLYAAPAYVARRGTPPEPEALMEHDALIGLGRNGDPRPWLLVRGDQRWQGLPPARATANSPGLLLEMALAGAGIALASDAFALAHVEAGRLAPVLADWSAPPTPAWAVFPGRRLMPARTRVFLDALATHLARPECQAVAAMVDQAKGRAKTNAAGKAAAS